MAKQENGDLTKFKRGEVRPGGRTEKVRHRVAQVVLDFLKAGNAEFSVADVAVASGIHRSTLYRRWKNQGELIQEALSLHAAKIECPDTGNWKQDLTILIRSIAEFAADPMEVAICRAMMNPENTKATGAIIEYWMPLMKLQAEPIIKAQEQGHIRSTIDAHHLLSLIISPLLLHSLVTGKVATTEYVDGLVEMMIWLCEGES